MIGILESLKNDITTRYVTIATYCYDLGVSHKRSNAVLD